MIWMYLLLSCGGETLSQPWQLDRIRVLAVRPFVDEEPDLIFGTRSEPRPGETLHFEALTYAPPDDPIGVTIWTACVLEDDFECTFSEEDIGESGIAEDGSGLIGIEPFYSPKWVVPADALDELTEAEQQEGLSALINIMAVPQSVVDDEDLYAADNDDVKNTEDLDPNEFEIAFKRVPVSLADTPNHNPDIMDIMVAGQSIGDAAGFTARTEKTYILEPILRDGHLETYAYYDSTGTLVYRVEEPYFSWYSEVGAEDTKDGAQFDDNISLYPYSSVEWTAPKKPGRLTLHVVVRDRRGGMGWRSLTVNVL